jgi:hypothetical protein
MVSVTGECAKVSRHPIHLCDWQGYDPQEALPLEGLEFFKSLPSSLAGIEACVTAHHWGRELTHSDMTSG